MADITKRWKIIGWDAEGSELPVKYAYDEDDRKALGRVRKIYGMGYSGTQYAPLGRIKPYDGNNEDDHYGEYSAIPCDWPGGLSEQSKVALDYLDDTAYLFKYMGKYVVTDEGGWLTPYGKGTPDSPMGFPRVTVDSLDELDDWLHKVGETVIKNGWFK